MTILPLTYIGNIEYFVQILRGECVIDLYEHYVKQTYRNRCEIMTSGGVLPLTVNVVKGGSMEKKTMRDIRIDYSKRWQHQHRTAIMSAYSNSPYFEHYIEQFEPLLGRKFTFLADLNIELLEAVMKILGNPIPPVLSGAYINASPEDTDLRGHFTPKRSSDIPADISATVYEQVFAEKFAFKPNLSVIDLLFCEGSHAKNILKQTAALQQLP